MSELRLIRKRCPHCGKAMRPDETGRGGERYVCPVCEEVRCTTPPSKNGRTARCARRSSSFRRIRPLAPRPVVHPSSIQGLCGHPAAVGHPLPATGLAG
jgi:hypothetical protein